MSVDLWCWHERCDESYCCGDCDNCSKAEMEETEDE